MARLRIMDGTGHTTLEWCPDLKETVEAANTRFDELLGKGYAAFAMDDQKHGTQIRELTDQTPDVLMVAPMAGGS